MRRMDAEAKIGGGGARETRRERNVTERYSEIERNNTHDIASFNISALADPTMNFTFVMFRQFPRSHKHASQYVTQNNARPECSSVHPSAVTHE